MNKHVVITISRQFGSNGREIGRVLAEYLDIGYYNKEIMYQIAKEMDISPKFFEEENRNDAGFFSVSNRNHTVANMTELSVNATVFEKASRLIQGIAATESAVIIGRCADYILKEDPHVIKVFCYSDIEDRIKWAMNEYKVKARKVRKFVQLQDQKRSGFYEFYSNQTWGKASNYDLMINTSMLNVDEVVELLAALYDKKLGVKSIKGAFMDQYIEQKHIDFSQDE